MVIQHGADADIFTANMYLAEDRVRAYSSPVKFYLFLSNRSCVGSLFQKEVDHGSCTTSNRHMPLPMFPIKSELPVLTRFAGHLSFNQVPELISQRRRWLNGSFFAAVHSTFHFHYIYRSSHTAMRKFWIHVELVYQVFNLIFTWFSLVCV